MTIGEKIRLYREMRGISQVRLASFSGINVDTIRKYELGIRIPKQAQLIKIARGLHISVVVFYDLDIYSTNDIMTLLFIIADTTDIEFVGKDEFGKYSSENIALKFNSPFMKERLCDWAKMQNKIDNMDIAIENESDENIKKNMQLQIDEIIDEFVSRMVFDEEC